MKRNTFFSVATATFVATLAVAGVTAAATPAANDTSLLNKGTVEVDSLKVGKQGSGGVTFFNGTIVNSTSENGVENPVTFGDDVRIDGRVWRGATRGAGDSQPFIIEDNAQVDGSLTVGGTNVITELGNKVSKGAGYISIPAADFSEASNTYSYTRNLTSLIPTNGSSSSYSSGIDLPHGSVITSFKVIYSDISAGQDALFILFGPAGEMARVESAGSPGNGVSGEDTSINNATVDNSAGSYMVSVNMPGSTSHELREVIVGYSL